MQKYAQCLTPQRKPGVISQNTMGTPRLHALLPFSKLGNSVDGVSIIIIDQHYFGDKPQFFLGTNELSN